MKKIVTLLIVLCISLNCNSQVEKSIKKIQSETKKCLDKGQFMLGCAEIEYQKTDDLLNIVYKIIKSKLTIENQKKLKQKQVSWLKLRDKKFKQIAKETSKELDGNTDSQDFRMICFIAEAEFVQKRIIELEKTYGVVKL